MADYISWQGGALTLRGDWQVEALPDIERETQALPKQQAQLIDAQAIESLDTAGAWQLLRIAEQSGNPEVRGLKAHHEAMLRLVARASHAPFPRRQHMRLLPALLTRIGKGAASVASAAIDLLKFMGETSVALARAIRHPRRWRLDSIARHIDETAIDALPIVALIAFLISVVVAYQGSDQLKRFGAEIFTIDMVAVSVLREMGVLLTAIMVAGRSGSAFAAEIGVMKVNEEVDAMRVIGLDPFEVLVLPRIAALVITLPLLTFVADVMGILGGGVICHVLLDIPPQQYIARFHERIGMWDFWVGIIKAPVFAFLIAVVGCMRGMEVEGSAESVGKLTTVAVVHSIFLVLLADALFSILFTVIGI